MPIASLTLDIHLPACHSLKEKRSRLRGLRDKFGREPGIAMSETDFHDVHDHAQWCVVAIAADSSLVQSRLRKIEDYIRGNLDGYITDSRLEFLR